MPKRNCPNPSPTTKLSYLRSFSIFIITFSDANSNILDDKNDYFGTICFLCDMKIKSFLQRDCHSVSADECDFDFVGGHNVYSFDDSGNKGIRIFGNTEVRGGQLEIRDRKSTRLNSSHTS